MQSISATIEQLINDNTFKAVREISFWHQLEWAHKYWTIWLMSLDLETCSKQKNQLQTIITSCNQYFISNNVITWIDTVACSRKVFTLYEHRHIHHLVNAIWPCSMFQNSFEFSQYQLQDFGTCRGTVFNFMQYCCQQGNSNEYFISIYFSFDI